MDRVGSCQQPICGNSDTKLDRTNVQGNWGTLHERNHGEARRPKKLTTPAPE
eukprot:CAMPEP_0177541900 /NCGR_PEP_ID=MMETSP0369-20130122/60475_1 /TAXON_ID=447022 ORGANISM="Scrippsiella hangoei-like, Strain SHHI-4" /NCGR_SAMPLE_ID=MMETSP0369 /ASSEMBLY_ACC=CAM_ASM_000364 /LENGTH=51 /DNA_ID=CAMNT_0019025445 /DNA_START=89 /DNA_END=242 /DNA_ORIENTATION=+